MFFQSVTFLSVIPAKAGIQELIDNWGIIDKRMLLFLLLFKKYSSCVVIHRNEKKYVLILQFVLKWY